MVISVISKWQNIPSTTCIFQSNDLFISTHVKQLHLKKTKDPSRASIHASLFPPTSINGLPAHYGLQKYTVTVSHLFHLQPSRCVWAASSGGEMWAFNAVCGMWRWTTLHLGISHLPARGDDEQVEGETAGNAEIWLLTLLQQKQRTKQPSRMCLA